jgi:hypothetical protein
MEPLRFSFHDFINPLHFPVVSEEEKEKREKMKD